MEGNPKLTAERLQWLEQLERLGSLEWRGQFPLNAAAHCREQGWTQVRMVRPDYRFLHELTLVGRLMLEQSRAPRRRPGTSSGIWP
jgi:hypothetical protein